MSVTINTRAYIQLSADTEKLENRDKFKQTATARYVVAGAYEHRGGS